MKIWAWHSLAFVLAFVAAGLFNYGVAMSGYFIPSRFKFPLQLTGALGMIWTGLYCYKTVAQYGAAVYLTANFWVLSIAFLIVFSALGFALLIEGILDPVEVAFAWVVAVSVAGGITIRRVVAS